MRGMRMSEERDRLGRIRRRLAGENPYRLTQF